VVEWGITSKCAGRSGAERTYDTIALYQRANSRLCALLHIGCYILLSIAIDIAPKFIPKTGLGGRRGLRLQLLEKDEYFPTAVQCCTSSIRDELHIPFSSGATMFFQRGESAHAHLKLTLQITNLVYSNVEEVSPRPPVKELT
jgi:hypothetical protein